MKKRASVFSLKKKDHSNLDIIGNRIRYLRMLTGLDRSNMEKRHQVKKVSLEKWENGTANISLRNITRLVSVAIDHSIECTPEWLVTGEGSPPKTIPPSTIDPYKVGSGSTTEDILRDLSYFKSTYPLGISLMISDDAMMPCYDDGDFVGGQVVELKDLKECLDHACIVHTADGKKRVRRIGHNDGVWFLYGTNISHKGSAILETGIEITKVAKVFWHRKQL